jgi:HK97 family phage major capsid protein
MKKNFMTLAAFLVYKGFAPSAFENMDQTKKDEILSEMEKNNREYFEDLEKRVSGVISKEEFEALKTKDLEAVKNAVVDLEAKLKAMEEEPKSNILAHNFNDAVSKLFTENVDKVKEFAENGKKVVLKSPVTIGTGNTIGSTATHSLLTVNTGIISQIRKRILTYLGAVSAGTISNQFASWVEELDEQGNPTFIGEAVGKPQVSVRYVDRDMKTRKIAAFVKVTKEMLRDLPQLISYVQNNLIRRIDIVTETALFTGDGTGTNLKGLITYATAFTGGGLKTEKPSNADVFRALALQVEKAFGSANVVFVRPDVLAEMDVEKADDSGSYLIPPFKDGTTLAGMRLVPTMGLPNGTDFVGGDLSVVQVLFREGMSLEMDRSGDDFTNKLYTILAEQELVQFVSANDTQLLVKGSMTTAITAITAS